MWREPLGVALTRQTDGMNRPSSMTHSTHKEERRATTTLFNWCRRAGSSCDRTQIMDILTRRWTDALEGADRLFAALGLPQTKVLGMSVTYGEARFVDESGRPLIRGISLRLEEQRYVPGDGEGFLGVWDREHPEAPIARFLSSIDGRMARDAVNSASPLTSRPKSRASSRTRRFGCGGHWSEGPGSPAQPLHP